MPVQRQFNTYKYFFMGNDIIINKYKLKSIYIYITRKIKRKMVSDTCSFYTFDYAKT